MRCDCINDGCIVHIHRECRRKAQVEIVAKAYINEANNASRKMCSRCAVDYAQLDRIIILRWL